MIFRENVKRIDNHNKKAREGKYSYYLKTNSHGDMLRQEFSLLMNGFRVDLKQVTWYKLIMKNFVDQTNKQLNRNNLTTLLQLSLHLKDL